jgi:hypothetical protein
MITNKEAVKLRDWLDKRIEEGSDIDTHKFAWLFTDDQILEMLIARPGMVISAKEAGEIMDISSSRASSLMRHAGGIPSVFLGMHSYTTRSAVEKYLRGQYAATSVTRRNLRWPLSEGMVTALMSALPDTFSVEDIGKALDETGFFGGEKEHSTTRCYRVAQWLHDNGYTEKDSMSGRRVTWRKAHD